MNGNQKAHQITAANGGKPPRLSSNDRQKMKVLFSAALLLTLCVAGCGVARRDVAVKDVSKNETIVLKKEPSQGSVTGIAITGHGSIVGKAEVQLIVSGAIYKREEVSGDVSFVWQGDWYADDAEVRYIAGSASRGTLTLTYNFQSL